MRNGIFGLFSLDGAPIDERDRAAMLGEVTTEVLTAPGATIAARDLSGGGVHVHRDEAMLAVLLGDLDEPEAVAARLGQPEHLSPAGLAAAALVRWGRNAPAELAGEWLLVRWETGSRTLTVLMSEGAYEACHIAADRTRVAIAPDLVRLTRLPWIDAGFDPEALMRTMGGASLRAGLGARTILRGVTRVRAGARATVSAGGVTNETPVAAAPPPLARVTFEEAVTELDALLRRTMRKRLAREGGIAVPVSGGLDSSLLAVLAAQERPRGTPLVFLTSIAPVGSGLDDESEWAECVARHLDVPLIGVTPGGDADVYRPSARALALTESPALSPRHYLYAELADVGAEAGARRLVDGGYGELTVSNHGDRLSALRPAWPGTAARMLRARWRRAMPTPADHLHVMPAPGALVPALGAVQPSMPWLSDDAPFGVERGADKSAQLLTATIDPRLRVLMPFRDTRLIRLMASLPAGLVRQDGVDRALARALLRGHLPEAIVTRPKGSAFSPSYHLMLHDQASAAIDRLDEQRRAGADAWLDLDRLERMLARVRDGQRLDLWTLTRIQGTAYAAEFFRWWRDAKLGGA